MAFFPSTSPTINRANCYTEITRLASPFISSQRRETSLVLSREAKIDEACKGVGSLPSTPFLASSPSFSPSLSLSLFLFFPFLFSMLVFPPIRFTSSRHYYPPEPLVRPAPRRAFLDVVDRAHGRSLLATCNLWLLEFDSSPIAFIPANAVASSPGLALGSIPRFHAKSIFQLKRAGS